MTHKNTNTKTPPRKPKTKDQKTKTKDRESSADATVSELNNPRKTGATKRVSVYKVAGCERKSETAHTSTCACTRAASDHAVRDIQ